MALLINPTLRDMIEQIRHNPGKPEADEAVNCLISAWQMGHIPETAYERYDVLGAHAAYTGQYAKASMYATIANALRGAYEGQAKGALDHEAGTE